MAIMPKITQEQVNLAKAVYENGGGKQVSLKVSGISGPTFNRIKAADWDLEVYRKRLSENFRRYKENHKKEKTVTYSPPPVDEETKGMTLKELRIFFQEMHETMREMNKRLEVIGKHTTEMADDIAGIRTDMITQKSRGIFSR